jgi:hypothetical protein
VYVIAELSPVNKEKKNESLAIANPFKNGVLLFLYFSERTET